MPTDSLISFPNAKMLQAVLTVCSPAQFGRLWRSILSPMCNGDPEARLSVEVQLYAYIYEWLLHIRVFDAGEVQCIVSHIKPEALVGTVNFIHSAANVTSCEPDPAQLFTITVSDSRYVTWTGLTRWFDVRCETFTESLKIRGMRTLITGCILGVFLDKQGWLEILERKRERH